MSLIKNIEKRFESLSEFSHRVLGSIVTIIIALIIVSGWYISILLSNEDGESKIRDAFIAFSFLTFFLVQRALHKYNLATNVKLNELVRAQENASNDLINIEKKTNKEIEEISKELHE
jgi:low affinity Fe/Cu permease